MGSKAAGARLRRRLTGHGKADSVSHGVRIGNRNLLKAKEQRRFGEVEYIIEGG